MYRMTAVGLLTYDGLKSSSFAWKVLLLYNINGYTVIQKTVDDYTKKDRTSFNLNKHIHMNIFI